MERLSSPQLIGKLQALKEDRRITGRLRTQLRQLILTELQNGPTARWNPVITVRGRALGSLLVEWLRIHDCHYTMSVLASEVPSLADLPGLANDGAENSLKKKEAEEILMTLGMKSKKIMDEYEASSESLLSCILRVAASWKARSQFLEVPGNIAGPDRVPWSNRLQHLVATTRIDPQDLPAVFSALNHIILTEVEERVAQEKRKIESDQLLAKENTIAQLKRLEEFLSYSLDKAQDELNKDKTSKEIFEEKQALRQLTAEIHQQHQVVIDGLQDLETREKNFEAAQKLWRTEFEAEKQRCKRWAQDLAYQKTQLEREKELFYKNVPIRDDNLPQQSTRASLTNNQLIPETTSTANDLKIEECEGEKAPKSSKLIEKLTRLRTVGKSASDRRSRSPLAMSDKSTSSPESPSQSSGATAAAWGRLKELREESKRRSEEFYERRIELASDSDTPPPETSQLQTGEVTFRVLKHSQATFPTLHEGCHNESPAIERNQATSNYKRYRHLLAQGDQKRRPSLQTRIPRMPEISSTKTVDVSRRLRYQSDKLNNLIQSARQSTTQQKSVRMGAKARQEKVKEQKLEVLLQSVRDNRDQDNPQESDPCSEAEVASLPRPESAEENGEFNSERESSPKKLSRIPVAAATPTPTPDLTLKRKPEHSARPSASNEKSEVANPSTPPEPHPEENDLVSLRETSTRVSRPSSLPVRRDTRPPLQRTLTVPPTSLLHATLDSPSLSDGEVISIGQAVGDFWQ